MSEYNALGSLVQIPLTEQESNAIVTLMENQLARRMSHETSYLNVTVGKTYIKMYLREANIFALVRELRSSIDSLNKDVGKLHSQITFTPFQNVDPDKSPISGDVMSFTYAENYLSNIDFLINNTKCLWLFIDAVIRDVYNL